tara:strand:+ start:1555 stop:1848 length:294 start_codon:yes stop_codon:yes gene_type:complete
MKLEYKIKENGKNVKKELHLIELGWEDFCKSTDLAIKISQPNGSQFTDIAKLVMLYTGKTSDDMTAWRNSHSHQADFINDVVEAFKTITKHIESKKK